MTLAEAMQARKRRTRAGAASTCTPVAGDCATNALEQVPPVRRPNDSLWRRRVRRRIAVRRAAPRAGGRGAVARRGRARRAARARQGPFETAYSRTMLRLKGRSAPERYFTREGSCGSRAAALVITALDSGLDLYEHVARRGTLLRPDWQFIAVLRSAASPYRGHEVHRKLCRSHRLRGDGLRWRRAEPLPRKRRRKATRSERDSHDDGARGAREEASARSGLGLHRRRRGDRDDDRSATAMRSIRSRFGRACCATSRMRAPRRRSSA